MHFINTDSIQANRVGSKIIDLSDQLLAANNIRLKAELALNFDER